MNDDAVTAPLAGVLLIGVLLLAAGAIYVVVTSFGEEQQPVFGEIEGRACSTVGRWTIARFAFNSLTSPLTASDISARVADTGRGTEDSDAPLTISAVVDSLRTGNRIWLTTQPGRTGDIDCDTTGSVQFFHKPTGRLLSEARLGDDVAHAISFSDVECASDDKTAVAFTLARVPPGLRPNDLEVADVQTGASTDAAGDQKLSLHGGSAPNLAGGDDLTLETKNKRPEAMACTDTLRFRDIESGATLREIPLSPT